MAIDLASMRNRVRKPVGIPAGDSDLLDTEIDDYLNFSFWEIMDKFHFREKERTGRFETVIGVRNYEIPRPVEAVKGFAIRDSTDNQHKPLEQIKAHYMEQLYDEDADAEGLPRKYLLENCYVRLWPTPDKIYEVIFRKHTILSDIQDSGLEIPKVWVEVIELGAIYRAFLGIGDLTRANGYKSHQVSLVNTMTPREEKEVVDYQLAGVEVLGRSFDIR